MKTPKLSPMADDAITRGGIGGLGSLVYICVCIANIFSNLRQLYITNTSQDLIQNKHSMCTFQQSAVTSVITLMRLMTVFLQCFEYCQLICHLGVVFFQQNLI